MAVRIREDGRILCAAMHSAAPGDVYLDDQAHYVLSVETGVLVTEEMFNPAGRGGHAAHGEWWWRDAVPADAAAFDGLIGQWDRGGATPSGRTARPVSGLAADSYALRALRKAARALHDVLVLDVVARVAVRLVVVDVARRARVPRARLGHRSSPWRRGSLKGFRRRGETLQGARNASVSTSSTVAGSTVGESARPASSLRGCGLAACVTGPTLPVTARLAVRGPAPRPSDRRAVGECAAGEDGVPFGEAGQRALERPAVGGGF
jgi:hypothetical protein